MEVKKIKTIINNTVNDKSSTVQNFHGFHEFSINCESFTYRFQLFALIQQNHGLKYNLGQNHQSFPYILIKFSEPQNFCTMERLSFTVILQYFFCNSYIYHDIKFVWDFCEIGVLYTRRCFMFDAFAMLLYTLWHNLLKLIALLLTRDTK